MNDSFTKITLNYLLTAYYSRWGRVFTECGRTCDNLDTCQVGYFCPEGQALHENGTCVLQETGCQCKHGDSFYDLGDTNPSDCSKLVLYIVFILEYHIRSKSQVSRLLVLSSSQVLTTGLEYQTCYKLAVSINLMQTCCNKILSKLTTQACNNIVISRLYQSCWNSLVTSLIVPSILSQVVNSLFPNLFQNLEQAVRI